MYWVDINLAIAKGLKSYPTRLNAIILFETLPVHCVPKVGRMETGEIMEFCFALCCDGIFCCDGHFVEFAQLNCAVKDQSD